MKERDVMFYPDALVEASLALINNEKLLSVFVTIVFKKTNAHDSPSVNAAFELITKWF